MYSLNFVANFLMHLFTNTYYKDALIKNVAANAMMA